MRERKASSCTIQKELMMVTVEQEIVASFSAAYSLFTVCNFCHVYYFDHSKTKGEL